MSRQASPVILHHLEHSKRNSHCYTHNIHTLEGGGAITHKKGGCNHNIKRRWIVYKMKKKTKVVATTHSREREGERRIITAFPGRLPESSFLRHMRERERKKWKEMVLEIGRESLGRCIKISKDDIFLYYSAEPVSFSTWRHRSVPTIVQPKSQPEKYQKAIKENHHRLPFTPTRETWPNIDNDLAVMTVGMVHFEA